MRVSLSEAASKAHSSFGFGKDVIYRFLNNSKTSWESLLLFTSLLVVTFMNTLTNPKRIKALIVDDTCYYRDRSKSVELLIPIRYRKMLGLVRCET